MNDVAANNSIALILQQATTKKVVSSSNEITPFSIIETNDKDNALNLINPSTVSTTDIIPILMKKPNQRRKAESELLISYLKLNNIESSFTSELFTLDYINKSLYSYIMPELQYLYLNKDNYIYKMNDLVENIYLILEGQVILFKYKYTKVDMTSIDYYQYLNTIYTTSMTNDDSKQLLQKTIEANRMIYPIKNINDLNNINNIIFICQVAALSSEEDGENKIKTYYIENNHKEDQYDFINVHLGTWDLNDFKYELVNGIMTKQEQYYLKYIDNKLYQRAQSITKIDLIQLGEVNKGEVFGNFTIVNECYNQIRETNAKVNSDTCVLCAINKKTFYRNLNRERRIKTEKDIELIYTEHFIKAISKNKFVQHIFPLFKCTQLKKGCCLLKQGHPIETFYLISEGTISLTITTSLIGLTEIINSLLKKMTHSKGSNNQDHNHNGIDATLIPPLKTIQHYLEVKREFFLLTSEKEFYGLWEYWKDIPQWFFTATVKSDKALYYEFSLKNFDAIKNIKSFQVQLLYDGSKTRMALLIERMIQMRKSYYNKINRDYQAKVNQLNKAFPFAKEHKEKKPTLVQKNNKIGNLCQYNRSKSGSGNSFILKTSPNHNSSNKLSSNTNTNLTGNCIPKKDISINQKVTSSNKRNNDKEKGNAIMTPFKPKMNYKNIFSPQMSSHRLKLFYLPRLNTIKAEYKVLQQLVPYKKPDLKHSLSLSLSNSLSNSHTSLRSLHNVPLMNRLKYAKQNRPQSKTIATIDKQHSVTIMVNSKAV